MNSLLARLSHRQRIIAGGLAAAGAVSLTLATLWVAGAFSGGGEEAGLDAECTRGFPRPAACPSPGVSKPTRTPRPLRTTTATPTPSPSGSATPTPVSTFGPTPSFPTPTAGPATPTPTPAPPPAPTLAPYRLVQDVSTATFDRMVEFVMIPGSGEQEAVVVSQHEAVISRVSLTGVFGASEYGNLSGKVKTGNEEGLLSLAFSPNFTADGRVYVYYTSTSCAPSVNRCVRVSRFQVVNNNMDETGEVVVLEVNQQLNAINHNGGRILFGPDGKLYISIGDGGGGGDPLETGQNKDDLLGNILRIDVTGQTTYIVPSDNPFVNADGADEVWAYGLRNPWRYSFDRATGLLWLGDVGQDAWEEVDVIEKGGNYGWDCFEGTAAFEPGCASNCCHAPRAVYAVAGGECAITGGYVYRGTAMPELSGRYIYGDFCSGKIWAFDSGNPTPTPVLLLDSDKQISSFAELLNGELLLLTFQNAIFRLTR